jgi:hypothetical protein
VAPYRQKQGRKGMFEIQNNVQDVKDHPMLKTGIVNGHGDELLLSNKLCEVVAGDLDYVCNPLILRSLFYKKVDHLIEKMTSYLDRMQKRNFRFVSLYFRHHSMKEAAAFDILGDIIADYKTLGFVVHYFNPDSVIALLKKYSGKPLLYSLTGEKPHINSTFPLLKDTNCPIVLQPIGDYGIPPKSADRMKIVTFLAGELERYGIKDDLIYVDALSPSVKCPLCKLEVSIETIKSCREVKLKTILWPENSGLGYVEEENQIVPCYSSMAILSGLNLAVVQIDSRSLLPYIHSSNLIKKGVAVEQKEY